MKSSRNSSRENTHSICINRVKQHSTQEHGACRQTGIISQIASNKHFFLLAFMWIYSFQTTVWAVGGSAHVFVNMFVFIYDYICMSRCSCAIYIYDIYIYI